MIAQQPQVAGFGNRCGRRLRNIPVTNATGFTQCIRQHGRDFVFVKPEWAFEFIILERLQVNHQLIQIPIGLSRFIVQKSRRLHLSRGQIIAHDDRHRRKPEAHSRQTATMALDDHAVCINHDGLVKPVLGNGARDLVDLLVRMGFGVVGIGRQLRRVPLDHVRLIGFAHVCLFSRTRGRFRLKRK